ncbi:MAG: ABC transporter ATP-binding protein [Candidatus Accumulibacter meliphilus]|jgi:ABC-2 type transport system ATP-binding protein|uniref:ABC transporter ATP-binding protein n=1 Tax=Candidatus Accumulibacter meliphilus TaxID=2211374 RepID=A0A369XLY9_9PROT|nr:MAG: ABC transporter ATP-binding protein [Candidatus Accumulibacter meliphilus]
MPEHSSPEADIETAAQALRAEIDREGGVPIRDFTQFAERFAIDPKLRDEAVVLGFDASVTAESADTAVACREMITLLDRIILDYRQRHGERLVSERAQRYDAVQENLQHRSRAGEVAFAGLGITKAYAKSLFKLGALDLTLRLGEITGVVGQNAHGKTTLLRIVAGELRHDEGTLDYPALGEGGSRIDRMHVKESLAYVPQELLPWRGSLRNTLHFEAAIRGIRGAENEREVRFVVERLGLGEHLDMRWNALSGGYKLRFALARALVWKPRLLVMDEPLANLDIKAKNVLLQDLRELASSYRYPIAVLISSHELHALEAVCEQMVFLRQGEVVYIGPTQGVAVDEANNEFELGTRLSLAELRQRLRGSGVIKVREEHTAFVLTTAREIGHQLLLRRLLEREIDVEYFRDNSRSVRRLFL